MARVRTDTKKTEVVSRKYSNTDRVSHHESEKLRSALKQQQRVQAAWRAVDKLNTPIGCSSSPFPVVGEAESLAPQKGLQELCAQFGSRIAWDRNEHGSVQAPFRGYGLKQDSTPRYLKAKNLALPKQGNVPVDFIDRMPAELQELFAKPEILFGAEAKNKAKKPAWMIHPGDYQGVLEAEMNRGMIELAEEPNLIINGAFGVAKGEPEDPLTRAIVDGTPVNNVTAELPKVRLPNPSSLKNLPDWVQFAAAGDLESYYNNLKLPVLWRPYFGLPPIHAKWLPKTSRGDFWYHPHNATLPLGWTGSVLVGQLFHEAVFEEFTEKRWREGSATIFVNLDDEAAVAKSYGYDREAVIFYLIYIDDVSLYGLRERKVNAELKALFEVYEANSLSVKAKKTEWAKKELRVLGVWLDLVKKEVRPVDENVKFLDACLSRMVRSKVKLDAREFQRLTGKMLWTMLIFRPSISILNATFAFAQALEDRGPLVMWKSVREELECVWGLLPMIRNKLGRDHVREAMATDATGTDKNGWVGFGVTYHHDFPTHEFLVDGWSKEFVQDVYPEESSWKWAIAAKRRSDLHVNMQEMLGFLLGLNVAKRHQLNGKRRPVLIFNDNQCVVGVVKKGRSGSPGLNCMARRYCAFILVNDWYIPDVVYIPTKLNPADAPSRFYKREKRQRNR